MKRKMWDVGCTGWKTEVKKIMINEQLARSWELGTD